MLEPCEARWNRLLDDLRRSPMGVALVAAGGGSGAIGRCFRRPGASETFVEAAIPYSRASMRDYLGEAVAGPSASAETACQLAARACRRAGRLDDHLPTGGEPPRGDRLAVGISLVAALPTLGPGPGRYSIHAAVQTPTAASRWSLSLEGGRWTRSEAETVADELIFRALASLVAGHDNDSFFQRAALEFDP
jgi:hypothetical protein